MREEWSKERVRLQRWNCLYFPYLHKVGSHLSQWRVRLTSWQNQGETDTNSSLTAQKTQNCEGKWRVWYCLFVMKIRLCYPRYFQLRSKWDSCILLYSWKSERMWWTELQAIHWMRVERRSRNDQLEYKLEYRHLITTRKREENVKKITKNLWALIFRINFIQTI